MNADDLAVLRENMESITTQRTLYDALLFGTEAELARLCRTGDALADVFTAVCGAPLCSPEFARFCRRVLGGITDPAVLRQMLPPEAAAEERTPDTRTAYLRSAYTDRAFAAFSRGIERLSAQYQASFSAGCEEVYYGRCSYCILPIRSTEDGTLTSFTRMIAKYDLKISRVCDVATQNGESTMRYALLRRGLDLRVPEHGILQAALVLPDGVSVGQFLHAAEATGAAAEDITTVPLRYSDTLTSLNICFRIDPMSAAPLLCFLSAVPGSCTPDGIYALV